MKLQGAGDQHIEKFARIEFTRQKFERISKIFEPILRIFANINVHVVSSKY